MTEKLQDIAASIRKHVVRMHCKGSNVGSAMSAADILAVLYFDVMNIPSPTAESRDRFILSKGHAASALYAALALKGFLDPAALDQYLADGSALAGHPMRTVPGVEAATGSLGHGLAVALGMAWAAKQDSRPRRHFVLMGDGELQEGSVWESAILAARLKLDNLIAIVDANGLQGYGRTEDAMPAGTVAAKFEAFGWTAREVDGHDCAALRQTLRATPFAASRPSLVLAHTVKGKGVAEMEGQLGWHYFSVPPEKLGPFLAELEGRP